MDDLELIAELESLMTELETLEDPLLGVFEVDEETGEAELVVEELTPELIVAHEEYEEKRDELISMIEEISEMLSEDSTDETTNEE